MSGRDLLEWLPQLLATMLLSGMVAWLRHIHRRLIHHEEQWAEIILERARYETKTTENLLALTEMLKNTRSAVEMDHELATRARRDLDKEISNLKTEVEVLKARAREQAKLDG